MSKLECSVDNARKFADWIATRGGVAVWFSANLSNPGVSWSTPATLRRGDCHDPLKDGENADDIIPYPKPTWQAEDKPRQVITSTDDVAVYNDKEVKRFHVAVRQGSSGMNLKCTNASSSKIRKAVSEAGDKAYYAFDYETQEAVIMAPAGVQITLTEWLKLQKGVEV